MVSTPENSNIRTTKISESYKRATILLVDDCQEDLYTARQFLLHDAAKEGIDFRIRESVTGEDGLAACRSEAPDCVLLDYYLPDMDGLEFLARLKNGADDLPVPVVVLTGAQDRSLATAALRAGAQEYLPKRFLAPDMLLRAIDSARDRFTQQAERRRTEALAANERLLRLAQEAGRIASYEQDIPARIIRWSSGGQCLLGFRPDQAVMSFDEWHAIRLPEDMARIDAEREAILARRAPGASVEFRIRRPDTGEIRRIEMRYAIEYDAADRPGHCHAVVLDVTEQRAAEDAVRASEARLRAVFDGTFTFIALLAPDGTLLKANRTFLEFIDCPAEAVEGRPFGSPPCWPDSPDARLHLREAISRATCGETVRFDIELNGPREKVASVDVSLCPVRDASGALMFLVAEGRDVTERHRAERALARSEERLRLTQEAAEVGTWEWDVGADAVRWSPENFRLHAMAAASRPMHYMDWLQAVHPDDRQRTDAAVSEALMSGKAYDTEYRVILPEGGTRWLANRGSLMADAEGRPQRMLGVNIDITTRRNLADALLEADPEWNCNNKASYSNRLWWRIGWY
ncbi:PAS domain-containing protein, partial [Rhodovastum atsumiense]